MTGAMILASSPHHGQKPTDTVPMIIVGNKLDVVKANPERRCVSTAEAESQAKQWDAVYMETSAQTSENVEVVYEELVRQIRTVAAAATPSSSGDRRRTLRCVIS